MALISIEIDIKACNRLQEAIDKKNHSMKLKTIEKRKIRVCFGLWFAYILMALLTIFIWTKKDWFPVTGDEPHYLVIADGIIKDDTFEQTYAYAREFKSRKIYRGGLAPANDQPSPKNTHAVKGPHGLYNVHNIGLPLIIALPFKATGTIGAKIFLVFISSLLVPLIWNLAYLFTDNCWYCSFATIGTIFAAPVIPASNQIYPDLSAGIIAFAACCWMIKKDIKAVSNYKKDFGIAILIAFLPWLQIKFLAAAMILSCSLSLQTLLQNKNNTSGDHHAYDVGFILIPLILSIAILAKYNLYAFGKIAGPYKNDALQVSLQALMVLIGIQIDRFQGIFVQNPVFLFGLPFLIPFTKKYKLCGITILIAYASLVVPNAMHPNWYGGFSFAGRFGWSGALTILPFAIYGMITALEDNKKVQALAILLISINFSIYIGYTFKKFDFYNVSNAEYAKAVWIDSYDAFLPYFKQFLPALFNVDRAVRYTPNAAVLVFCIGLILLGIYYQSFTAHDFYRRLKQFILTSLIFIFVSGITSTSYDKPIHWKAAQLMSNIGVIKGNSREASCSISSKEGFLTYGPYIKLERGRYKFSYNVEAYSSQNVSVGQIDIYVPAKNSILKKYTIVGRNKLQAIKGTFEIQRQNSGKAIEVRTYYNGIGTLVVHSLSLSKVDSG